MSRVEVRHEQNRWGRRVPVVVVTLTDYEDVEDVANAFPYCDGFAQDLRRAAREAWAWPPQENHEEPTRAE
jgi:hypothetical protein